MRNILKLMLATVCMFAILQGNAQTRFGLKGGLNLSTMTLKQSGISIDPKTLVGFHVGVISEFDISKDFFIQPGVLFSTKGSKYSISSQGVSAEFQMAPSFLEIPVHVVYKMDLGGPKLLIGAGPYFAFGIGGKSKMGGESQDIKFGSGDTKDLKPFDFGIDLEPGVEFNNLQVTIKYGLGITNLAPVTTDNFEMKMKVFSLSVAYLFGNKK